MIVAGVKKGRRLSSKTARVHALLEQLRCGSQTGATLQSLLTEELGFSACDISVSTEQWSEDVRGFCSGEPLSIAVAGRGEFFHVVYVRLASEEISPGHERSIINNLRETHSSTLVVFSNVHSKQWHFVHAKSDRTRDGALILRRISIDQNDRLFVAAQLITGIDLNQLNNDSEELSLEAVHDLVEQAFDIEKIQRMFFQAFIDVYSTVLGKMRLLNNDRQRSADLVQGLIDRLIFLCFIQRKGWFANDCFYLNNELQTLLAKADSAEALYFSLVLEPIFDRLAGCERQDQVTFSAPALSDFFSISAEERMLYRSISDETYSLIFRELLEKFNFTPAENTVLDEQLSIDPEMLGKVFEQIILQRNSDPESDLRKTSGSFYTPRTIVHYMSQQALTVYLTNYLSNALDQPSETAQERIESLFSLPPADQLDDDGLHRLQSLISREEAELLKQGIYECRVCDPSVGTGAFIIGIMHEMESAVSKLDLVLVGKQEICRSNHRFNVKRQLIENSLYGVDIQEQAVRLCHLRLVLSLAVELSAESISNLEGVSFPNLSHKVVVADSLLEQVAGKVLKESPTLPRCDNETHSLAVSLSQIKARYLHETDALSRAQLTLKIHMEKLRLARQLFEYPEPLVLQTMLNLSVTAKGPRSDMKVDSQKVEIQSSLERVEGAILGVLNRLADTAGGVRKDCDSRDGGFDREKVAAALRCFDEKDVRTFAWHIDFVEVFSGRHGFDIVIGNPPYRGNGLRGNKRSDPLWTERIRQLFPGSAEYKIEQYALFYELALRITNAGGTICFVTPDSYLLGMYFQKIRKSILQKTAIRSLVQFEKDFWKAGVVGRPTIALLERSGSLGNVTATLAHTEEDLLAGRTRSFSYSQSYFQSVPLSRFRLFFAPIAKRFVTTIEQYYEPLKTVARIWSGVRSKIGQQQIQSREMHDDEWRKGITSSSLVLAFKNVEWGGDYLHIQKEILWSGGWDAKLVESPKVMIRQTGDTLIAGLDYRGLYHLNNVHGLSLLKESQSNRLENARSLEFICALLNSRLMRRFYHLVSQEYGRTMAQTDIETLELLPLREPSSALVQELSDLIRTPTLDAVEKIDQLIEELYGLDEELIAYLRQEDFYPTPGFERETGVESVMIVNR
ncbi:MAG: N-6 DNA methylase [Cyanobacteria bacterium]|nr:N-6 DNA methylase [Cyanobacteriota bacterium]